MSWRLRRSTVLLSLAFATALVVYFLVRPPHDAPGAVAAGGVTPTSVIAPRATVPVPPTTTTTSPPATAVEPPHPSGEPPEPESTTTSTPFASAPSTVPPTSTTTRR